MIFHWNPMPGGNVDHIAANDVTPEEVEEAYFGGKRRDAVSRGSGRPAFYGTTRSGRRLFVTYDEVAAGEALVKTAYEVPG